MLRQWLIMGFGIGSLMVMFVGVYVWTDRPATYHDAVIQALDRRQIAYTGLDVREICLPDPTCFITTDGIHTYAAVVVSRATYFWLFRLFGDRTFRHVY